MAIGSVPTNLSPDVKNIVVKHQAHRSCAVPFCLNGDITVVVSCGDWSRSFCTRHAAVAIAQAEKYFPHAWAWTGYVDAVAMYEKEVILSQAKIDSMQPVGKMIFIDWNEDGPGDDDNDGLTPETAVFSQRAAIDLCDFEERQDFIFTMG